MLPSCSDKNYCDMENRSLVRQMMVVILERNVDGEHCCSDSPHSFLPLSPTVSPAPKCPRIPKLVQNGDSLSPLHRNLYYKQIMSGKGWGEGGWENYEVETSAKVLYL